AGRWRARPRADRAPLPRARSDRPARGAGSADRAPRRRSRAFAALGLRLEVRRQLGSFAEEALLTLLEQALGTLARAHADAALVDEHRRVRDPELPALLGHVLVDALAELIGKGRTGELLTLTLRLHVEHRLGHLSAPPAAGD